MYIIGSKHCFLSPTQKGAAQLNKVPQSLVGSELASCTAGQSSNPSSSNEENEKSIGKLRWMNVMYCKIVILNVCDCKKKINAYYFDNFSSIFSHLSQRPPPSLIFPPLLPFFYVLMIQLVTITLRKTC